MAASRKTNINSPTAGMRPSRPVRCNSYYGSTFVYGENLFRLIDESDNESTVGLVVVFGVGEHERSRALWTSGISPRSRLILA
jgi:hypothetical protein